MFVTKGKSLGFPFVVKTHKEYGCKSQINSNSASNSLSKGKMGLGRFL
jgi:hypothetical protein